MTPFFSSAERQEALRKEAATWIGTPFLPRGCNKGRGVDCISLCAMIYLALGVITVYRPPEYSMDGGAHLNESLLEREIHANGRFVPVWESDKAAAAWLTMIMPGDLLVMRVQRVTHHAALVVTNETLIQAFRGPGVAYGSVRDPAVARKVRKIYRPIEV